MKIIFIGAGNLATQLAKALLNAGHDIIQVYSRTKASASVLATIAGGAPTTDLEEIRKDADLYILAVKDSVLGDIIPQICKGREDRVFVHTAGSMPMNIFQGMALHYGVFYPMQTFSKNRDVEFAGIPVFIEGNDHLSLQTLHRMGESISNRVYELSTEDRKYLHLAAVFACNFVNHCYTLSSNILSAHHIPFDVMLPLIDETAAKVHDLTPFEAQTGPAVRFDENIIRAQAALLKNNPLTKDIYERMSMSIHRTNMKNKRP